MNFIPFVGFTGILLFTSPWIVFQHLCNVLFRKDFYDQITSRSLQSAFHAIHAIDFELMERSS